MSEAGAAAGQAERPPDASQRVAVCICTRNRPDELAGALEAIAAAAVPGVGVVVSDDSDPAQADRVCALCARHPRAAYVRGPLRGLGANRNQCLRHLPAGAEVVVFLDDDVRVRPAFLEAAAHLRAAYGAGVIVTGAEMNGGRLVPPHNLTFLGHQELPAGARPHAIVINAAIFPRDLFDVVRFDEALRYGSDEIDLCGQAEAAGYRIDWRPELVNDHCPSPVNREEYRAHVEVSRLYATYKRYRWLQRNPGKAAVFLLVAAVHLLGYDLRHEGWSGLRSGAATVRRAWELIRAHRHPER